MDNLHHSYFFCHFAAIRNQGAGVGEWFVVEIFLSAGLGANREP